MTDGNTHHSGTTHFPAITQSPWTIFHVLFPTYIQLIKSPARRYNILPPTSCNTSYFHHFTKLAPSKQHHHILLIDIQQLTRLLNQLPLKSSFTQNNSAYGVSIHNNELFQSAGDYASTPSANPPHHRCRVQFSLLHSSANKENTSYTVPTYSHTR